VLLVDAKDVMPSACSTTGRPFQSTPIDPNCQNHRGPMVRFIRSRPVSPGRRAYPLAASFVAALQLISLAPLRQGLPVRKFSNSSGGRTPATPSNYST